MHVRFNSSGIIAGQVGNFIGTDAFQETDFFGITLPIVKHSYTVRDTKLLPKILLKHFISTKWSPWTCSD